jgi:hypothetical protein
LKTINNKYNENRIIGLWAFSESILGGFLHLFKIPVTGLLVGGLAIIFLSLLSYNNENKSSIIKGTIIVLIIKFVISPYTPFNAFLSVTIQGLLCYVFSILTYNKYLRVFGFAISSMIVFSSQKLIFIQVLLGSSLWEAIDSYTIFIVKQFGLNSFNYSLSFIIISLYVLLHILSGILFSILSIKIMEDLRHEKRIDLENYNDNSNLFENLKKKPKKKYKRILSTFIILLIIGASYFIKPEGKFINYLLLVIRFFSIFIIWAFIITPLLTKLAKSFLSRQQNLYKQEVNDIIDSFSSIKSLSNYIWEKVKTKSGFMKYILFVRLLIVNFILE